MADKRLQALARLLPDPLGTQLETHARVVPLRTGQIVMGHQDSGSDVFAILEGSVRVELHSLNGKDIILADLGPDELFGEFAAIDGEPRSASVTATSASLLARIPGDAFRSAVLGNPETAEWIARRLVTRIRLLTERIFELNSLAVRSRLHCELLRLCLEAGVSENRAEITPVPTHAELASRIGTHREAVTRELKYLKQTGVVDQKDRSLAVADVSQLTDIVRAASGDVGVIQRAADLIPD
ncbi:MAG: Crp/Fnr family transcriptional regulator [Novosphingobium sp.]